jgi:putative addiction module killer protein
VKLVREYLTAGGASPYRRWLETLDLPTRARIQARVMRFEIGNLGDHKSVGGGVWEARLAFGPGYRIYFGRFGEELVLLLLGGDKGSRAKDIRTARQSWTEFLEVMNHGKAQ